MKESPIRIEHVPPETLGGSPKTLTCFECNSWAGYELESSLFNLCDNFDFMQATPGSSVEAKINFQGIAQVNANLKYGLNCQLTIGTSEERTDPKEISKLRALKGSVPCQISFSFMGKSGKPVKARRAECALLRIAYLIGFSQFGYAFIAPRPISLVRSQIQNPDSNILPTWGIASADQLPDKLLGINLVTHPKILRSFATVFELKTHLRESRYLVLLPGLSDNSERLYEVLASDNLMKNASSLVFKSLPDNCELLRDPKLAFMSHWIWGNL